MTTLSPNTRGALLMMGSMAAFTMGDACVKAIGEALPLSEESAATERWQRSL